MCKLLFSKVVVVDLVLEVGQEALIMYSQLEAV